MIENKKNNNQNNFSGTTNFNGLAQVATGDIINNISANSHQEAKYKPEPIWRSPFTLAVLSWISVAVGILGVFPIGRIAKNILGILSGTWQASSVIEIQISSITFAILFILFILIISLRQITKNQTRHPMLFNYAISGYGGRLTLEKIHIDKCPQCGGKMRYYNKPVEWRKVLRSDGGVKHEVTKKVPAIECKRNSKHWYEVDPAEDKVD